MPRWPGAIAAGLVLCLTLGTLAAVSFRAEWSGGLSASDWAAVRFTVLQAAASAALSIIAAIPVARALARRRFRGRGVLITLMGAPFILPVIVAIIGLLAVFGRGGLLNSALSALGLPLVSIYGFQGVVLAHVFFNLPLAVRLILHGWLAIPAEQFRVAASLNMPVGRYLEWPMLRAVVPGVALAIFLICLTSFAVALTLGGGPKATTVELAIYQALRFEFDMATAARLAMIQFVICATAAGLAWLVTLPQDAGAGFDRVVQRWDGAGLALVWDVLALAGAMVLLLLPLGMVVQRGIAGLTLIPEDIWSAALRSLAVAVVSALLCSSLALALALRRGGVLAGISAVLPLAASGLMMGTGLFIMVWPFVDPAKLALPVTAMVNAAMALPFAYRALAPALEQIEAGFGRTADSLGMTGAARLRWLILPRMRRPLGFATGLAAAMSMGDLGVIALFARSDQETLPLAMFQLMGAYQMEAAAGVALILLTLSVGLFWLFDRGGRADA
ncbi:thiamine/thiamine pyrophosphate ABC transporter permease ThiP [Flavimaricola marinus]|uniref:thiamine/thiamine pyrophosphate ABC transporter permease ThiP n=1 Tax=Flavimaricola marinus TaxID=1819565 RepID=UPI00145503F7